MRWKSLAALICVSRVTRLSGQAAASFCHSPCQDSSALRCTWVPKRSVTLPRYIIMQGRKPSTSHHSRTPPLSPSPPRNISRIQEKTRGDSHHHSTMALACSSARLVMTLAGISGICRSYIGHELTRAWWTFRAGSIRAAMRMRSRRPWPSSRLV